MPSQTTVKNLAAMMSTSAQRLLAQLKGAGMHITHEDQVITAAEKKQLLDYLQKGSDTIKTLSVPKKIVITRKKMTELKVKNNLGKAKTISIEVRKKRTYVQEDKPIVEEELVKEAAGVVTPAPVPQEDKKVQEEVSNQANVQEAVDKVDKTATPTPPAAVPETKKASPDKSAKVKKKGSVLKERKTEKYKHNFERSITEEDIEEDQRIRIKSGKARKEKGDPLAKQVFEKPSLPVVREVPIPESISVANLAQRMSVKATEVIRTLMKMGVIANINQEVDQDTAVLVVEEMNHIPKPIAANAFEEGLLSVTTSQRSANSVSRAAIVTVMGHVDHGKTSLLDYIRRTKVTQGEAGGITQHIGAYHVETPKGVITFLDTPGHAAFTAMRARGAKLTDIVVLVVAADDGVMPQTVEAIQHAKAANVPIVVAINKIDKPEADLDRIRSDLSAHGLVSEAWGGDTMFVSVSAKTGTGIDELLDSLLVQAEVLELKASLEGPAQGIIIESRLDKNRGPAATMLVQQGILRKGDVLLSGTSFGRVRALLNEQGKHIDSAGPSMPVEVLGLSTTVTSGDEAIVVGSERKAREVALFRQSRARDVKLVKQPALSTKDIFAQSGEDSIKILNIVLKVDVQGSAEALQQALSSLVTEEVKIKIIACSVGGITESDVNLALASKALILGFNVRADHVARQIAENANLIMHYHSVIYDLIDEVKNAMSGLLLPTVKENTVGFASVREVFRSTKLGAIAGCMVTEGIIRRNLPVRVLRENIVIHEGELNSLRRFKEDVSEVRHGTECGIGIKNYSDIRIGDQIEVFERTTVARTIS